MVWLLHRIIFANDLCASSLCTGWVAAGRAGLCQKVGDEPAQKTTRCEGRRTQRFCCYFLSAWLVCGDFGGMTLLCCPCLGCNNLLALLFCTALRISLWHMLHDALILGVLPLWTNMTCLGQTISQVFGGTRSFSNFSRGCVKSFFAPFCVSHLNSGGV